MRSGTDPQVRSQARCGAFSETRGTHSHMMGILIVRISAIRISIYITERERESGAGVACFLPRTRGKSLRSLDCTDK